MPIIVISNSMKITGSINISYKQLPSGIAVPGSAAVKSNASPLKQVTVPDTEDPTCPVIL